MEHEVLIGTVKNLEQLSVNLNENFYHIPEAVIPKNMLPVEYVALFIPSSSFGNEKICIHYYGKVTKAEIIKRKEITSLPSHNGEMNYYRFLVESWKQLPNPIIRDKGGIYAKAFTSLDTLLSAKKLSDIIGENKANLVKMAEKGHFWFTDEQIANIELSEDLIAVNELARRINESGPVKVHSVKITKFLLNKGYLKRKELFGNEYRIASEKGNEIGIFTDRAERNGKIYYLTLYDKNAQQFVVDNLNKIIRVKLKDAYSNE